MRYILRQQNAFLLGWNWGSEGIKIDSALFINSYHDIPNSTATNKIENIIAVEQFLDGQHIVGNRFHNAIINSMSAYFEPTLNINPAVDFVPSERNTNGAVFGFLANNKI